MTAYVSNHQKKKDTLSRREADLLRAIEHEATREKILMAAQDVRDAHVRVLEAEIAAVPPCDGPERERVDRLNAEMKEWLSCSVEDVTTKYTDLLKKHTKGRPNQGVHDSLASSAS
jgi:hypothetical protein